MGPEKIKIVFFGTSPWSAYYQKALEKEFGSVLAVDKNFTASRLQGFSPDLGVMAYFGKILPKEVLAMPRKGILNVHHSLLPKLRGPSPVQAALLAGDAKTGVSIIVTSEKVDAGEIAARQELKILPGETYLSLEKRLIEVGTELLLKTIPAYLAGKIALRAQDESQATYCKIIKTADGKINWTRSVEEIWRQIRALNPEPGTFTFFGGKRLIISGAIMIKPSVSNQLTPGKVIQDNSSFKIAASDGFIKPEKVKLEGRKELIPDTFLKGHSQILGAILD